MPKIKLTMKSDWITAPALHKRDAISLEGIQPRLFILLCCEYGKYGITAANDIDKTI